MVKQIKTYFHCEYPGCPVETDAGFLVDIEGVKLMVCQLCMKEIKKRKRHEEDLPLLLEAIRSR
jgi:ribosome-binding protein aMBF1 (putative translation factor)